MYAVLLPAFTAIFPSEHRPAALPHCQASQRPTWYLDIFLNAIIAFIFPKSTLCRNPPALYCSNPLEGLSSNLRKNALPLTVLFSYNRTVAQKMPGRTREEGAGAGVFQSCQKRSILISCPGRGSQIRGTYIWLQLRPPGHTLLWRKTGIQSCAFGRITCSACKTSAAAATALPL